MFSHHPVLFFCLLEENFASFLYCESPEVVFARGVGITAHIVGVAVVLEEVARLHLIVTASHDYQVGLRGGFPTTWPRGVAVAAVGHLVNTDTEALGNEIGGQVVVVLQTWVEAAVADIAHRVKASAVPTVEVVAVGDAIVYHNRNIEVVAVQFKEPLPPLAVVGSEKPSGNAVFCPYGRIAVGKERQCVERVTFDAASPHPCSAIAAPLTEVVVQQIHRLPFSGLQRVDIDKLRAFVVTP